MTQPPRPVRSFGSGRGTQLGAATAQKPGDPVLPATPLPVPPAVVEPPQGPSTPAPGVPEALPETSAGEEGQGATPAPSPSVTVPGIVGSQEVLSVLAQAGDAQAARGIQAQAPPQPPAQTPAEEASASSRGRRVAPKVTPAALANVMASASESQEGPALQDRLTLTLDPGTAERLEGIAGFRQVPTYLRNALDAALNQKLLPQHILGQINTLRALRDEQGQKKVTVHITRQQLRGLEVLANRARRATPTSVMEGIAYAASLLTSEV